MISYPHLEYQAGLINNRGGGGANSKAAADELNDERKRILEEREKWEQEKNQVQTFYQPFLESILLIW